MTTIAYPSREFPGLPSVAVEVPEGWQSVHVPGTTLAARLPRDDEFAPNVVLTVEQGAADWSTERSLTEIRELAPSHGGDVSAPYAARLAGRDYVGCDVTWPDADVDTILQANLFRDVLLTTRVTPSWENEERA